MRRAATSFGENGMRMHTSLDNPNVAPPQARPSGLDVASYTSKLAVIARGIQLAFIATAAAINWVIQFGFERLSHDPSRSNPTGHVLASMFERMGPTFIKLGQVMSSRPDLIGSRTAQPLARLRDHVRPMPAGTVIGIVEAIYQAPLDQLFVQFTPEPVASGSIAQVHTAVTRAGQRIAVKVQRPGLKAQMARDFVILRWVGGILERLPGFGNVPFRDLFRELNLAITAQTDFEREAQSNQKFQQNLENRRYVKIPRLVPELCNHAIVTMEYVSDLIPVDAIRLDKSMRRTIAKAGLEAFYQMIFIDGFVHADLHPGNVFFRESGEIVMLDFGLMATLDKKLREQFRLFFFAMAMNDGKYCARIVQETAQSLAPDFNAASFAEAMSAMVDRFAGRRVQEFEVARFVIELFDLQRRHGIRGSTGLAMTLISLLLFEGVLKTLDPELDFQNEARAFMLTLPMRDREREQRTAVP
jgi:ubiquinone biosynthesis protein